MAESGWRGGTLGFDRRVPGQPPNAETITDSEEKTRGKEVRGKEPRPKQVPFKHLLPHPGALLG